MVILGVDPGSNVTGYAFLVQGKTGIKVLEYGAIKAKATESLLQRLGTICSELEKRILIHAPTMMAMEGSFYAKNVRTAMVLGHARGAVLALAARHGMDCAEYSPRSIKQAVTGTGAADKDRVARMMQMHLKLATLPEPADASDALAVAWTHCTPAPIQAAIAAQVASLHTNAPSRTKVRAKSATVGNVATALKPGMDLAAILRGMRKRKRK